MDGIPNMAVHWWILGLLDEAAYGKSHYFRHSVSLLITSILELVKDLVWHTDCQCLAVYDFFTHTTYIVLSQQFSPNKIGFLSHFDGMSSFGTKPEVF